jgi:hypothetical protein
MQRGCTLVCFKAVALVVGVACRLHNVVIVNNLCTAGISGISANLDVKFFDDEVAGIP